MWRTQVLQQTKLWSKEGQNLIRITGQVQDHVISSVSHFAKFNRENRKRKNKKTRYTTSQDVSILLTIFQGEGGKSANDVSDPVRSSTMLLEAGELSLDLAPL